MKTVKVTLKVEFEIEDADQDSIFEGLVNLLEYQIESGELMENAKVVVKDNDDEDSEEMELEEDED
jgi:hypothetical protein